jgi:hypothetical protein
MLGWICEKMATQESAPGGGRFFVSGLIAAGNDTSACSDPCVPSRDCSIVVRNSSWDNAHTSDPSNLGERLGGEPSTLVQHAQPTGGRLDG